MPRNSRPNTRVYSTDGGGFCPGCRRRLADCVCVSPPQGRSAGDGVVRLRRETRGRKGAGVTLVTGLVMSDLELRALASELKKRCGVGGAVRAGVIELQGEQRQTIKPLLEARGLTVRIAGGEHVAGVHRHCHAPDRR